MAARYIRILQFRAKRRPRLETRIHSEAVRFKTLLRPVVDKSPASSWEFDSLIWSPRNDREIDRGRCRRRRRRRGNWDGFRGSVARKKEGASSPHARLYSYLTLSCRFTTLNTAG